MKQESFFQNFLIRIASALSVVFLILGVVFLTTSYYNQESTGAVGVLVMIFAVLLAVVSLIAANFSMLSLNAEIKEAAFTADRIANGEILYNLDDDDESELKVALKQISQSISEKARIAERISTGDLSEEIKPKSETDVLGQAFRNMSVKLREIVQTEIERESLHQSIRKLASELNEVSSGNLMIRSEVSNETTGAIVKSFNSMTEDLRDIVKQIKDVSYQVGAAANSVSDTTAQISRGSEAQTSQIMRTTSAISEMSSQMQEVSENASLSVQVAGDSLNNARYGMKAAQDNISAMYSIRNQVQDTSKRIKKLGERSQEISHIVLLIDDLSDRTGLLALNASLQAAGAGDAGRGFALVAEEVERIAERSNQLTQQIAGLAQTIQNETKDVVASMEETIHEVVVGSTLADKAGQSLVEIERVSGKLSELLQLISDSTRRQAQSSDDISKSMSNVSKVTEMVQEGMARAVESVKDLLNQTEELHNAIAPFKLPEDKFSPRKTQERNNEFYLN